jgi:dTDP-4-dehydrorhamnose 3,5-epimerase-like enzyme
VGAEERVTSFPGAVVRQLPRFRVPLAAPITTGGIIEMPAGDFIQVANGSPVLFVAHLEFRAAGGASRGNHVHRVRTEWITVVRGRLLARYVDVASGARFETELSAGDQVEVRPGCAHSYRALEDAAAVECSSHAFDPADAELFQFE